MNPSNTTKALLRRFLEELRVRNTNPSDGSWTNENMWIIYNILVLLADVCDG